RPIVGLPHSDGHRALPDGLLVQCRPPRTGPADRADRNRARTASRRLRAHRGRRNRGVIATAPARPRRMSFALFIVLNAVLLIRPEDLLPEIAGTRLYLIVIALNVIVALPDLI